VRHEGGIALVMALLVLLVISLLAATLMMSLN
jgi:Tfp pilus assembly protein PilX